MNITNFDKIRSKIYDYVVVGSGITGCTIANRLAVEGNTVLVVEKRNHIGGNCYTERKNGIHVHKYGAHIFRTENKDVWNFVNKFTTFLPYVHKVVVNNDNNLYSFPINLMTLNKLHPEITTPLEVREYFKKRCTNFETPANLEEQCTNLIGQELFEIFIKGYTEKQWGRSCKKLPASIINRVPVRLVANDNYFLPTKIYQGMPVEGYTTMFEKMLDNENIEVVLNTDIKDICPARDKELIYTGPIDEFFDYKYGYLEWRSLVFKETYMQFTDVYQSTPVVNYTSKDVLYTRTIEHKQFNPLFGTKPFEPGTWVTYEYPKDYKPGDERYYPVNTEHNNYLVRKYLNEKPGDVIFAGRLGTYQYLDMDVAIEKALELVYDILH